MEGKYPRNQVSGSYYAWSNQDLERFVIESCKDFLYINPLHFDLFPMTRQIECEVSSMTKNLFHTP